MKMVFEYSKHFPWIVVFIILLLLGGWKDLYPKRIQLQRLKNQAAVLIQANQRNVNLISQRETIERQYQYSKKPLLGLLQSNQPSAVITAISSVMLTCAEQNGFYIQSLHPAIGLIQGLSHTIHFKVIALGNFKQFAEWVIALSRYSLPIQLNHFMLVKQTPSLLRAEIDFSVMFLAANRHTPIRIIHEKSQTNIKVMKRDPFVSAVISQIAVASSSHIEFQKIKFIGYLINRQQQWALALLPNKKMIVIKVGDDIGREKARLIRINEQGVWVNLFGKTSQYFYWFEEKNAS